jgi:hypothetical protein
VTYIFPLIVIKFLVFCLQPPTAGNVDYCWTLAEVKVEVDEETAAEENSTHVASTEEQRLVSLSCEYITVICLSKQQCISFAAKHV